MADITDDKGYLDGQPSDKANTQDLPDPAEKRLDHEADESAQRASKTIRRYDTDNNIFTK